MGMVIGIVLLIFVLATNPYYKKRHDAKLREQWLLLAKELDGDCLFNDNKLVVAGVLNLVPKIKGNIDGFDFLISLQRPLLANSKLLIAVEVENEAEVVFDLHKVNALLRGDFSYFDQHFHASFSSKVTGDNFWDAVTRQEVIRLFTVNMLGRLSLKVLKNELVFWKNKQLETMLLDDEHQRSTMIFEQDNMLVQTDLECRAVANKLRFMIKLAKRVEELGNALE